MFEKAFAVRAKDWLDVEGILIRQSRQLDWTYIRRQLKPLAELKESPEMLDELEGRRVEFERWRAVPTRSPLASSSPRPAK